MLPSIGSLWVLEIAGAILKPFVNVFRGARNLLRGGFNRSPARMAWGLGEILASAFPGYGCCGGLMWPGGKDDLTLLRSTGTRLDGANIKHDKQMPTAAFSSDATFQWIHDAIQGNEHGTREPGPYGQLYRAVGIAAFGLWGTLLKAVGR